MCGISATQDPTLDWVIDICYNVNTLNNKEQEMRGPNMSYCMCENTLLAMHQIINAMREEGPMFLHDLSRSERESFEELFNACETFMNFADELVAGEEAGIEPDCYEQERTSLYR